MNTVIFTVLIVLIVAEIATSGAWMSGYFRIGIPVYRREVLIRTFKPGFADELERWHASNLSLPLIFRAISVREIAFREKAYGIYWLRYAPVMRGLIHVSNDKRHVYITGLLNWYVLLLIALLSFMLILEGVWAYIVILIAFLFTVYAIQRYRYGKVGDSLESFYGK